MRGAACGSARLVRTRLQIVGEPFFPESFGLSLRVADVRSGVQRYPYKPKITKKMPDYHKKQRDFENNLKARKEELKAQVEATVTHPPIR